MAWVQNVGSSHRVAIVEELFEALRLVLALFYLQLELADKCKQLLDLRILQGNLCLLVLKLARRDTLDDAARECFRVSHTLRVSIGLRLLWHIEG